MATRAVVTCRRSLQDGTERCLEKSAPCRKSCVNGYAAVEKWVARYVPLRMVYFFVGVVGLGVAGLLALIGLAVPPALEAGLLSDIRGSVIKRNDIPLATALSGGIQIGEKCEWVTMKRRATRNANFCDNLCSQL